MNRRRFLFAATAFTLLSTTAARADYVEDIVKRLGREGYAVTEIARTLLGRVRIRAAKDGGLRELVCNPRTGEILRDVWTDAEGNVHTLTLFPDTGHDDNGDDNSGRDNDDEGDDSGDDNSEEGGDDDDDRSGDDGKSGHGGGDD